MLAKYFKRQILDKKRLRVINDKMVQLTQELNLEYKKVNQDYEQVLEKFINIRLIPEITRACHTQGLDGECYPLQKKWNNANLSGFLTYAGDSDWIEKLYVLKGGGDLRIFYNFLREEYNHFDHDKNMNFSHYLKSLLGGQL